MASNGGKTGKLLEIKGVVVDAVFPAGLPEIYSAVRIPRPEGGAWAALRIGVAERFQRNHIATALLAAARRELEGRAIPGGLHEIVMSAWRPNPAAAAFAARHGFHHVRCFWKMERAAAGCPEPVRPPGVWPGRR